MSYNVACATEQTGSVKPSKLRSSLEVHCTARRLCFAELTRRRDRGTGERFSRPQQKQHQPTTGNPDNEKVHSMLYTIAVILLILWALGLVTSYTLGGFVHILLVVAAIMILVNLLSGRRAT
jgi:Flp pilus assembly protein TadB